MLFNLTRPGFGAWAFSFVGDEDVELGYVGSDWMMAIPVSGTLTLKIDIPRADICIVAGGEAGAGGGGGGGDGGEVKNITDVPLAAGAYTVTVGGSGGDSSLVAPDNTTWTAQSGGGSSGGSGNNNGEDGALAWGDANTLIRAGWLYGAGGGRGSVYNYQFDWEHDATLGGSVGSASDDTTVGKGGDGHYADHREGYDGLDSTGQGGGGGSYIWNNSLERYVSYSGGSGGSGVILIRKHKEVS